MWGRCEAHCKVYNETGFLRLNSSILLRFACLNMVPCYGLSGQHAAQLQEVGLYELPEHGIA